MLLGQAPCVARYAGEIGRLVRPGVTLRVQPRRGDISERLYMLASARLAGWCAPAVGAVQNGAKVGLEQRRVPELDGARGIAILMVLLGHCFYLTMLGRSWSPVPRLISSATKPLGAAGVDLFFVLSGYLITGILVDSAGGERFLRNFYSRRALRILPLYYLTLILILFVYRGSLEYVLLGSVYLSNVTPLFGVAAIYGPLWSLSVEEHFYLAWPWLVKKLSRRGLAVAALTVCAVEPLVRAFAYFHGGKYGIYYYSWFRFDSLATGALLALFVRSRWHSLEALLRWALGCFAVATLLSATVPGGGAFVYSLGFTYWDLVFAALLAAVLSGKLPVMNLLARSRWLTYCGEISYFLYLSQWMVLHEWDLHIGGYPAALVSVVGPFGAVAVRAAGTCAVCFALGEVSRRYFEGPILRLKRYFAYSVSSVAEAARATVTPIEAETAGNG